VLAAATLRIIDRDKRRVGRVDVHAVVGAVLDTFGPFFLGRRVAVMFEPAPAQPFMRGSPAALESIVTNLINNSLAAMEMTSSEERRILVRTSIPGDIVELEVQDSGTGIEGISMDDIWLPGESRRDGGTGLGLTIVRDSVADLGGTVEARAHGELGGALFTIQLPILGS
jgi:C4-dicarboxylate-specific signal transduction histidine kinase